TDERIPQHSPGKQFLRKERLMMVLKFKIEIHIHNGLYIIYQMARKLFFYFSLILFFCSVVTASHFPKLKDDQIKTLRSRKGTVLINFWATWCQPCQTEIPALNRLQKKYSFTSFIGINLDSVENRGAIKGFLKKHPIDYDIYLRDG